MAVSGHSSEGHAGSQGRGLFSCRLLSLMVWNGELCGSGAPVLPSRPNAGWSFPAGCKTPSWVKVQPQGGPLASWEREPLTTSEPPLPTQRANTYSAGFAVERGGGRTERMERKGGKQRWGGKRVGAPNKGGSRKAERSLAAGGPRAPPMGGWGRPGAGPGTMPARSAPRGREGRAAWGRGARVRAGHGPRLPVAPKLGVSRGAGTWARRP